MTASVGDFVTAVLLAELTADDELSTLEASTRRKNLIHETFTSRHNSRKLLLTQMCNMFGGTKKENNDNKRICKGSPEESNKDAATQDHCCHTVPVPYMSYAEFHEFQTYFGIKQEVFDVCPENCIVHRSSAEKADEIIPSADEQPVASAEELSDQQQDEQNVEQHNLLCLHPVQEDHFAIDVTEVPTVSEADIQTAQPVEET